MLEPEQGETDQREQNVGVENRSGVPRGKVPGSDDLNDMTARSPQEKARGAHDSGEPHVEASAECKQAHSREAQARKTNLFLERAVCPTNEPGGDLRLGRLRSVEALSIAEYTNRVSIELSGSVEEQLRNLAAKQGRDVRALVEEAIRVNG